MRKSLLGLLVTGALAGFSVPSWAAPVTCPGVGNIAAGCNTLITINANGTATVTVPNSSPYDGVEDNLVGIQNNSTSTVSTVTVSGTNIAGFDLDGAFQTGNNCIAAGSNTHGCLGTTLYALASSPPDPNDYSGSGGPFTNTGGLRPDGSPAVSFTSIPNVNTVVLGFLNGGLATGQFAYFSLEEPPTTALTVVIGTPEPASMALLGTALFGLYGFARRRRRVL